MKNEEKTNVMRLLESRKIPYTAHSYEADPSLTGEEIARILGEDPDRVFCIGGGSIYRQFLPHCDTAYVTKIDHVYEADSYFPDLDADEEWEITNTSDEMTSFDLTYHFVTYERKKA